MDTLEQKDSINDYFWTWKGQAEYVDTWFLMATPYPVALIIVSYLLFVLKLGPEFMRSRPAYTLKAVLVLYNGLQVIFSIFLVYNGVYFTSKYGFLNRVCIVDNPTIKEELLSRSYWYLIAKVTELLDTIFFVLRKKQSQVSFLHVYHHTLVVVTSWLLIKYNRTDDLVFVGSLNSFVHIIMYTYYGLSVFPNIARHLWWKKYLTTLQLVQFMMVLIYFPVNTAISSCEPSVIMGCMVAFNGLLFLHLFLDFYKTSYLKKDLNKTENHKVTEGKGFNESKREKKDKLRRNLK